MRLPQVGRQAGILAIVIVLKSALMTVTPLNPDLSLVMSQIEQPTGVAATPYGVLLLGIYGFWRALPLDHPILSTSWTVQIFQASTGLYVLVFLVKLPILVLDLGVGVLLYRAALRFGLGERKAKLAFYLWYLNPYVLLVAEMSGSVDIYPTFLFLFALTSIAEERELRAVGAYAAAVALKLFPILILPKFFALHNRLNRLLFVAGIGGTLAYFGWVTLAGYDPLLQLRQYGAFTQYFDQYFISDPNGVKIGLVALAIIPIYALLVWRWPAGTYGMFEATLIVFLIYFAFGRWFPQFLIWLIPFLVLDAVKSRRRILYVGILLSSALFFDIVLFSWYFTTRNYSFFFIPLSTDIVKGAMKAYLQFAGNDLVILLFRPFAHAVFVSISLIYGLELIERRTKLLSTILDRISSMGVVQS